MTEPTSARIRTPEQLDTARDIVQTWSCDPIRGGRSVVRIDQVLTELLGVHQLTEEIDWLLRLIQELWNDPHIVAEAAGDEYVGFIWLGETP